MSTLLLRLAGPLQSWGIDSKYESRRGTGRTPTKSGVIGLVAAALGRKRDESIEDLNNLKFGVRIDREGMLLKDYHTAKSGDTAYVTNRYYLSDAVFLAGLEGDEAFLEQIEIALRHPAFPLFLGRRSCPPEGILSLGIRKGKSLLKALREEPWLLDDWARRKMAAGFTFRIVTDADEKDKNTYFQRDVPISFNQVHRKFGFRRVTEHRQHIFYPDNKHEATESPTLHDPILELEED